MKIYNLKLALFLITLVIIIFLLFYFICSTELIAAIIALIIGLFGIFQKKINNFIFSPKLKFGIVPIFIPNEQGGDQINSKYYNFKFKNIGHSTLWNIRVKIKSEDDSEWLNLVRPFSGQRKEIELKKLSVNEEDHFTIGCVYKNDIFELKTDPKNAYDQELVLKKDEQHTYFIEIVSDNLDPKQIKIIINNRGFEMGANIKIL